MIDRLRFVAGVLPDRLTRREDGMGFHFSSDLSERRYRRRVTHVKIRQWASYEDAHRMVSSFSHIVESVPVPSFDNSAASFVDEAIT